MTISTLLLLIGLLGLGGLILGRRRALALASGDQRLLHSRPLYAGFHVFIWVLAPALLALVIWSIAQPLLLERRAEAHIPADSYATPAALSLIMADVARLAGGMETALDAGLVEPEALETLSAPELRALLGKSGVALGAEPAPATIAAALEYRRAAATGAFARAVLVVALALAGGLIGYRRLSVDFRARNAVEQSVMALLMAAAMVAILTTLGIVASLIFNTYAFFQLYPAREFFFGTVWSPMFGGGSQLGILPLLWGTLYISFVALLVAVPIGLFAAIYLAEYASPRMRSWVKPALEVLAGIPTIVYGLFALVTVGPALVSVFGADGLGWMKRGDAVVTAGLVMGVMLVPFVSSLSDDIINAVPQALRDGSFGLGATKSETIRQVVLPAALPGIVGAVLLAASRAIGETMIVVMGAGAAAALSLNPFEAMTTVTAKIVSQLTGDGDFASPEALVAFALGMSLFLITLALNVLALWIVRRYREQYE